MPSAVAETHPRPQLTRPRWTDLTGTWQFAHDDDDRGLDAGWNAQPERFTRTIQVPFPPESRLSGVGETGYHPVVWYRRTFTVAPEDRIERVLLHFGAVDYRAHVWVNGRLVATHAGGHTPFSADITAALQRGEGGEGGEHTVVVRAEDDPHDLGQPRGKQDWEPTPHRIWYHRTTGIWQPVWLEPVPDVHLAEVRWTPDLDRGTLALDLTLNRRPERPVVVRVRLALRGEPLADHAFTITGKTGRHILTLDPGGIAMRADQLLWSPRLPNLVDATLSLESSRGATDTVESYVGLRSCAVAHGRFLLNNRPLYLRLVLSQGYWPESHLATPSAQALRREAELVKELGFNGVRIHQKVEDPRFLYWCDRLGLVVWGEMANAFTYSPDAAERFTREWLEVVRRDRNHPCVVAWVPVNESWGVPSLARDPQQQAYVRALYHLTHALDGTRPVIGNDGWEHVATDIWGIHDYALDGDTLRERYGTFEAVAQTIAQVQPGSRAITVGTAVARAGEPVMLTEFGGISHAPDTGTRWFGYGTVKDTDAYLARYTDLVNAVLDSPAISGFCYTQLTDTEQETNGLLTANREPKLPLEQVRAITSRPSAAIANEVVRQIQQAAEVTPFSAP